MSTLKNDDLSLHSPALFDIIKSQLPSRDVIEVDPSRLRYALYVRKSTDTEERQVRSIPDQIKDCYELVINPYNIIFNADNDIFQEKKSAKEAGTRPEFKRMMDAIGEGKYDGIIAWHYDRLARNMKEAGEIIDLVDRNLIKDLKLAKATFENTPNGKMILGINFVLSKHYSDHLSESVLRGNNSRTLQGIVLRKQVHGYKITDERRLVADGSNYLLIEKAFRMRLEGKSLKTICDFLNNNAYHSHQKNRGHKLYKFDVDAVSKLMKEPTYAGIYTYGTEVVYLNETDHDFTPMITEKEYMEINNNKLQLSSVFRHTKRSSPRNVSNFLRNFVVCDHCKRTMETSITTKVLNSKDSDRKKQAYFRFRCGTTSCPMKNSGPRGGIILDYVLNFLDSHLFTTESNYQRYRADAAHHLETRIVELTAANKSLTSLVSKKRKEYKDALSMAANVDSQYAEHYSPRYLNELKAELEDAELKLKVIRQEISTKDSVIKSYDEYLKLFKNVAHLLRSTNGLGMSDEIIRIFFSNFVVAAVPYGKKMKQKQWSVIDHRLCEPFHTFVENGEFISWSG